MALTDITIDFDLSQLLGSDFDSRRTKAYVTTNVESGTLMDTSTGETRLGDEAVTIASDGTGSFTTWAAGVDGNPISWQTSLVVDYPRTGHRDRKTRTFGPWTLTTADDGKNITELEDEQAIPAEYQTAFTDSMESIRDDAETAQAAAEAARDDAVDISGISTSDGVVEALVKNTGGAGPLTSAALSATIAAAVPDASTTVKGRVELATTAEATIGTDSARALTPAGAAAAISTKAGNLVTPIQQLLKPATVMAVPATITVGNGGTASTIASGVTIAPTSAKLRYFGAYAGTTGAGWYSSREGYRLGQNIQYSMGPWGIEFDFDGDKFEVGGVVNTADIENIRFRVDGEFVSQATTTNHPASGTGNNYIKLDLGSRKVRRIRVEFSAYFKFRHFIIPPTSTMWLPSTPFGPRAIAFGDSFTEGADGVAFFPNGAQSWVNTLGDYLGWKIRPAGVSGTGYLNPGSGGTVKYRDRATQDLTAITQVGGVAPVYDYIIVSGGINDSAYTAADFTTEIPLLYATIRAAQPTAKIIVVLPFNVRTIQQLTQAKVDAIRAAWVATGDVALIIETVYGTDGAWFFGTGQVGATTGDGNADFYRSTDGLHPSSSSSYSGGHDYIASRVAAEIRKGLAV